MSKQKILVLTLEFPQWLDAAKYPYEFTFGFEEGLLGQGIDCLTIPLMFGNSATAWGKWFDIVYAQLRGKSFDQVWFEVTHTRIPAPFLEFLDSLAPVRLGFVCESIQNTPEGIACNPAGAKARDENLAANLKHTTHIVAVDEADVARFNGNGNTPAFWWAGGFMLKRFIASEPQPATNKPALFHGTLYGERARWMQHPDLAGLLVAGTSLESTTPYPAQWDRLSGKLHHALIGGEPITTEVFNSYIDFIRTARRETYPLWLKSLASGSAVVSLPSILFGYTGRVTQAMSAGRPVICCEIADRPRTSRLFEDGKEILLYSRDQPAQLAEHIRHIQSDPAFGRKVAVNALAKMRRYFTGESFVTKVLKWIETGAQPDYGDGYGIQAKPSPAWLARSSIPAAKLPISIESGGDLMKLRQRGLAVAGKPLRLHLGCGEQRFEGYVNIDYPSDQHNVMAVKPDYCANITQLDFPPQSVDEIRLHHVFEHFNRVTALAMLIKWQQWLKVGGKLHIETPDIMGSAEILTADVPWPVKMGTIRHLAGDQAASWAYHLDHWFPARYQHTLQNLGFGQVQTQATRWPHPPHLCNVHAVAIKTEVRDPEQLLAAADALLWESTVAPVEKPTHEVWTRQLRAVLAKIPVGPANLHTEAPPKPTSAPQPSVATAQPMSAPTLPERRKPPTSAKTAPSASEMPLGEIHDFNQRGRDRWVAAKARTVPAGARVLDMGAGTCLYRPLFAHCDYKTHDFKQYEGAEKHGGTAAYGQIDYVSEILEIPVPDHSFDVVLCTEVLEHVPEPIKVLREISRILKPGGRAFITAPLGSGLHQLPFHFYGGYTPEWYKRFCREAAMDAVEITPNGGFFKHLAQECARAGSLYAGKPELHDAGAAELVKLLHERLPRFFFALDDKCFDDRFTVGYFVEAVRSDASLSEVKAQATTKDPAGLVAAEPPSTTAATKTSQPRSSARASSAVVAKLMGGMGNQMFQLAAGLALARRHDAVLKLDLTFLQDRTPRPHFTPRDYMLGQFHLPGDCELIRDANLLPASLRTLTEKHFHYDPQFDSAETDVYLDGYWQSPRYFASVEEEIRKIFVVATDLDATTAKIAAAIQGCAAVCLHVRRGDMVKDAQAASVHGSCAAEYYRAACDVITRKVPDARFFIFSDDPEWCKSNDLTRGRPHTVVSQSEGLTRPEVDLHLMCLCRHFVTANSTFSWWAAFLGGGEDKIVVVPEPWFSDVSLDASDLVPRDWIRLSRCPGPVLPATNAAPAVSVVVPCYKQAHYLPEAVESVVAQTFPDWELIIVNDGSPDDTSAAAREIIARHPERRIRLVEKTNGGLADARNAGIKTALGKYILPLDADDRLHPEMLRKTVALLDHNPKIAIAYTDLIHFGAVTKVVVAAEYDFSRLPIQNQLNACSLYRRDAWTAVGGYNPNMKRGYEDWDFWVGCGEKGFFGRHVSEPLLLYRVKHESMYTDALAHHDELHAQIVLNHPRLYTEATRQKAAKILAAAKASEKSAPVKAAAPEVRVSVVIPCYKQAEFLSEAVQSVVDQTFTDWEILIVNDGSPDDTSEVAGDLIAAHPGRRIRLIEKANGGLADARNAGIGFARGKYILPLDADDKIHPEMLARTVALLEANPGIAIAYTDWQYFGAESHVRCALDYDFQHLCTKENLFTCTSLFRKEAWSAVGGFNRNMTHGVEDWDFWIACGQKGFRGQRIPEVLFYYRAKSGSMIQTLQPHLKTMFARIVLNHPTIYGAENVAKAQKVFDQAQLPPPKDAAPGVEWLPETESAVDLTLRKAARLIRGQQLMEAIAELRSVLAQAPGPRQVRRAQALIASIPNPGASKPPVAEPATPAGTEFFGPEEVATIERLITAYGANSNDPAVAKQVQELQQGLVDFIRRTEPSNLEALFRGDFGRVYRRLLTSGVQWNTAHPKASGESSVEKRQPTDNFEPADLVALLADMLLFPADALGAPFAFDRIPTWLRDDYIDYLLWNPGVFTQPGEAERYAEYRLALVRAVHARIVAQPNDRLTELVALQVTTKASYIPLYCSAGNTREVMEKRGAIMEYVLRRKGASLNATFPKRPKSRQKIKVGYLNAHFGPQTETHVALSTLRLDRSKFEISLFALHGNPSPLENECRSLADSFVVLPEKLPEQVQAIRKAGLDVLIIGTNITAVTNGVSLVALHRLAPLQLASYCSPMSTGFRHIDGYLTGSVNDFDAMSEQFTERLVVCDGPPGCLDYSHERAASTRFDRGSLGIGESDVVYVNAAACYKILPEMVEVWARILRDVKNSRLLLLPFNPNWSNRFPVDRFKRVVGEALQRHGLDAKRVIMAQALPSRADVKELEKIADVYLDTYPFSGSLSVIDPLELALPTLVWPGNTTRSRAAASLLQDIDMPELIAADERAYVAAAAKLGSDAAYRAEIRRNIAQRMQSKPRFIDPAGYGKRLSDVLEALVLNHGKPTPKRQPAMQCA